MESTSNAQFREFVGKVLVCGSDERIAKIDKTKIQEWIIALGSSDLSEKTFLSIVDFINNRIFVEHNQQKVYQFANQVVKSDYTYPPEFRRKSEGKQIIDLAKNFGLDKTSALKYLETIIGKPSILPDGCHHQDGKYAIVSPFGFQSLIKGYKDPFSDELYCKSLLVLFDKFQKQRNFYNYRSGQIDNDHLTQTELLLAFYESIASSPQGKNHIWLIDAQLGFSHKGESVNRAREIFMSNEYGLGSVATGAIVYNHPNRCVRSNELDMDCPGDKFSPDADGVFSWAPFFFFSGGRLGFGTRVVSFAGDDFGSASAFLPQL